MLLFRWVFLLCFTVADRGVIGLLVRCVFLVSELSVGRLRV